MRRPDQSPRRDVDGGQPLVEHGYDSTGKRRIVERGGFLLAVVNGPLHEIDQRFALRRVAVALGDEQERE